jgi:Glyoxalase-like domain
MLRRVTIRWLTAFLDFPADFCERGSAFWRAVTDSASSAPRGADAEFTLLPVLGDAFLRIQRLHDGPPGCHLDLHADDRLATVALAERLGATVSCTYDRYVVLRSPGGLSFCVVNYQGENERPPPTRWPGRQSSLVDQLSVDIPPDYYDAETAFWTGLTGWPLSPGSRPEFTFLTRPAGMPLRLLLQRLDDSSAGGCTAHLDLACDNVPAEQARHEALGAQVVRVMASWTTLRDPAGLHYCITGRDPATGTI